MAERYRITIMIEKQSGGYLESARHFGNPLDTLEEATYLFESLSQELDSLQNKKSKDEITFPAPAVSVNQSAVLTAYNEIETELSRKVNYAPKVFGEGYKKGLEFALEKIKPIFQTSKPAKKSRS